MSTKLFVYGSLKQGESAHQFLENFNAIFVGKAVTSPEYHLYQISWFPGMVIDDLIPGEGVHGEVYEVSDECLERLDNYEGAPDLFRRETVVLQDGSEAVTYIFVQAFSGKEKIESGVWHG